jgi:hypothetical protein
MTDQSSPPEPAHLGDDDPEEAGGLFDEPGLGAADTPEPTRGGAAPVGDDATPSHPEPGVGQTGDRA